MKRNNFLVLAIVIASTTMADDFDSFDDSFDDAFNDDAFADVVVEDISTSVFSLNHQLNVGSTVVYNSDMANATEELWSGVTSVRSAYQPSFSYAPNDALAFNGEIKFAVDGIFWLRAEDSWSDADMEQRQYQVDVKQLLAQYRLNNWQLSSGVQNVTLGLADALSVANVLYAQNISDPGATDIVDTLKPAWTSMLSGTLGPVWLKLGAVHKHQVNDMPVAGTDFDIVSHPAGLTMNEMLSEAGVTIEAQALQLENMGWFASFSGVMGALDWQLNAVSQLAHTAVISVAPSGPPYGFLPSDVHFPRLNSSSAALSLVTGSFLWKAEAAFSDGLQAQSFVNGMPGPLVEYQRAAGTFGFDFDHSSFGRLIAELQYGYVLDFDSLNLPDSDMAPKESSLQWALIYRKSLLREQLALTAQMIAFDIDSSGGRMQGLGAEYDVSDSLTLSARVLDYVAGSYAFLNGADDRDRIMLGAEYRF